MTKYWNAPIFKQLKTMSKFDKDFLDMVFNLISYFPYGDSLETELANHDTDTLFAVVLDWMIILTLFSNKATNNLIVVGNYHAQRIIHFLNLMKFNCLHMYQGDRPSSKNDVYDKPPAILPSTPPFM